jgi:transcription elongation factor GreA
MIDDDAVYLTAEGLQKIKEELAYLIDVKRVEVSERLSEAIKMGDLKENADYDYAKQEQGFTEARIKDLEDSLRRAKIITNEGPANIVRVGSFVTFMEVGEDDEETYHIVGKHEADPGKGKISNESPFGVALLGAKKGQTVRVLTPRGETKIKVLKIS